MFLMLIHIFTTNYYIAEKVTSSKNNDIHQYFPSDCAPLYQNFSLHPEFIARADVSVETSRQLRLPFESGSTGRQSSIQKKRLRLRRKSIPARQLIRAFRAFAMIPAAFCISSRIDAGARGTRTVTIIGDVGGRYDFFGTICRSQ